jgi:hypothetical protein
VAEPMGAGPVLGSLSDVVLSGSVKGSFSGLMEWDEGVGFSLWPKTSQQRCDASLKRRNTALS